jgi:hypothetical protein
MVWLFHKREPGAITMGHRGVVLRQVAALPMFIALILTGSSTSSRAVTATNNVGLPVIPLHFTNQINSTSNLFI